MNALDLKAIFGMKPEAAIQYLQNKGYKIGWDWHETLDAAHARAFTVAKVARVDVLQDIHQSLITAMQKGQAFDEWAKNLEPTLKSKGWWGKQIIVDATGNAKVVQLGSMRRLRTIYDTNISSAYMAAKEQFYLSHPELQISHPYVKYIAILDGKTRPAHRAMSGRIFRYDDPIWQTCKPKNGFGCRCNWTWVSQYEVEQDNLNVESSAGKLRTVTEQVGTNPTTGAPVIAERTGMDVMGVDDTDRPKSYFFAPDAGFNSAPAEYLAPILRKVEAMEAPLATRFYDDMKNTLDTAIQKEFNNRVTQLQNELDAIKQLPVGTKPPPIITTGERWLTGSLDSDVLTAIHDKAIANPADWGDPLTAALMTTDSDMLHWLRDAKSGRGASLSAAWLGQLPTLLAAPTAIYLDVKNPTVIYVYDLGNGDAAKVVIAIGFDDKTRLSSSQRATVVENRIRTVGIVPLVEIQNATRYEQVK